MLRCRMDKLRNRLQLPKAKSLASSPSSEGSGLESMIRETMYFVWPVAGVTDSAERHLERFLTHEDETWEGDLQSPSDDENGWVSCS